LDLGKITKQKKVFTIKHLEKFQLLDLDKFHIFHMAEHIFIQVSIQNEKGCRPLEQSMKTDTFQQEVPLSLPTCVTDHVEYLRIDCGNAHCTIEQRRLQYTFLYTLWGGAGGYSNLRQPQLCDGKGDSEVYRLRAFSPLGVRQNSEFKI
jgi:hypothetical protein